MEKIEVGSVFEKQFLVDEKLIIKYSELTGDKNPLHINEEFVSHTKFKKCIAHGGLIFGFISNILGTDFPGPGTVYVFQNLVFLNPIYADTLVVVKLTVKELLPKLGVLIQTDVFDIDGNLTCSGEAKIKLPEWCQK